MLAQWTADLVGQMHKWKISMKQLADHMGLSREYVSMVLNAILMYQTAYDGYANYYNRSHLPKGRNINFF